MGEPVRIGIIGCGKISNEHGGAARGIQQKFRFVACSDVRRERADAWAAKYGADAAYTDYEEMIRREKLDGVLLATWPTLHREQIERCLALGVRNILSEKPLTMTGREALEIWEMVQASGAFLMEGFMFRHHPAIRRLEKWVEAGEIGRVDSVWASFNIYDAEAAAVDDPNRNWRQNALYGGGVPYDLTCYAINACGCFSRGVPVRVMAVGYTGKYQTIDRQYGIIEYDNGCVGMVSSSRKGMFDQGLRVTGSEGILELPIAWTTPGDFTVRRLHSPGWNRVLADTCIVPAANPYQLEQENLADVIRGEARPGMPLAQSVANVYVIEALVTSVLEKRPVDIHIPEAVRKSVKASWEAGR